MVTKQQLDAMGKILPVQGMEVCGVEGTPCISVISITHGLKIGSASILDKLLPDINYIMDVDGKTAWMTVECLIEFVKSRQKLPNKTLITAYLQSVLPATQEG
jgi:hypothetical protein